MVSMFEHANIIKVLDAFDDNGTEYMVMEYFDGETLAEYMDRNGPIVVEAAISMIAIILDALTEVHAERNGQIHIHRDIKPSNVYLALASNRVTPKLLDFGAARTAIGERTRNLTQVLTPGYAPFEQYQNNGKQGPWTDVYAAAATLYHMLTGVRPMAAADRAQGEELANPRVLAPDITEALADALMKGLAMNRTARPQSAREFLDLLEQSASSAVAAPKQSSTAAPDPPTEIGSHSGMFSATSQSSSAFQKLLELFRRPPAGTS